MMRRASFAIALGGGLLAATTLLAQQAGPPNISLADAARQAGSSFQPVAAADMAKSKAEVVTAMDGLDAFLRPGAPYKAAGWRKYLQWNDLLNLVQSPQPPAAEPLNTILAKLRANQGGLERPEFTRLRDALANYSAATAAAGNTRLQDEYGKRME